MRTNIRLNKIVSITSCASRMASDFIISCATFVFYKSIIQTKILQYLNRSYIVSNIKLRLRRFSTNFSRIPLFILGIISIIYIVIHFYGTYIRSTTNKNMKLFYTDRRFIKIILRFKQHLKIRMYNYVQISPLSL